MTNNKNKERPLQSTLEELQKAFSEWDSVTPEPTNEMLPVNSTTSTPASIEIRKKTKEILEKLNEQIKELGL